MFASSLLRAWQRARSWPLAGFTWLFPPFLASQMKHTSVGGTRHGCALGIKGHMGCLGEQWWERKPRREDSKVMMAAEAQSL